ncbi:uncharacterized protein LOC100890812 [Strongylocentrotus purpuratus]|uniref:Uncharacterized protein n=1 Tax=Strongylocentrotus purpuratus TaxID=7668 RepID=A0A7M7GMN8_STRPU|nr:uncharacterized protein LOC100890812 [Strongylocentrotus purpuratus]|eukprot:XP_003730171.1 PREDICTED: uncharacterized protein LOC100890812 [Strongylocentrotus purpuratus]
MSSFATFLALFVVFVCSMSTMAKPTSAKMIIIETLADLEEQQQAELQIESFIGAPANQEVAPTDTTEMADDSADVDSDSASSESSEEESPTDTGTDTDADTDAGTADGGAAAVISNGGVLPIPNINLVNEANTASGNQLPMKGQHLPSNQDVSPTAAVGVAIAAMIMVGFVVGSIVFVIKKYRHNFPVVVRV